MSHPFKKEADKSKSAKMKKFADGGALGDIGSRNPGYGGIKEQLEDDAADAKNYVDSAMYSGPGVNDRFHDSGTRIPGRQKARNDAYSAKLKGR